MLRNSCRDCSFSSSTAAAVLTAAASFPILAWNFLLCLPRTSSNLMSLQWRHQIFLLSSITRQLFPRKKKRKNYNKSTRNLDKQKGKKERNSFNKQNHDKIGFFYLLEKDFFSVIVCCWFDIINCMLIPTSRFHLWDISFALCCSSKGIWRIKKARKAETARSCVRYWKLLGWHRPQFVRISVRRVKKK